jgi:ribosomal protein S18 acetylase RimI-like enzyme
MAGLLLIASHPAAEPPVVFERLLLLSEHVSVRLMEELAIVSLNEENTASEHICCGFSDKKSADGYQLKKEWLCNRYVEGFRFKKFDVRGKAFIEYSPAEVAWRPIEAPGYMAIHCFWVSGRFKGHGLGKQLLSECLADAKGMNGIVAVTSRKTIPFLTDKGFFVKHGFEVCDSADPYFELVVLSMTDAPRPRFRDSARYGTCDEQNGVALYYTNMCPFTEYYVEEMRSVAVAYGLKFQEFKLKTHRDVLNGPSPFGIFGAYYNGIFLTHEIMSKGKFEKTLRRALETVE